MAGQIYNFNTFFLKACTSLLSLIVILLHFLNFELNFFHYSGIISSASSLFCGVKLIINSGEVGDFFVVDDVKFTMKSGTRTYLVLFIGKNYYI
jgi:hypothetical protein